MIAVDTSLVVRYLVGTPPAQARRAQELLDTPDRIGLSIVVLLETGHVLQTQYGVRRPVVLDTLLELITRSTIETLGLSKVAVIEALTRARSLPGAALADALVVAMARDAGADAMVSFDHGIGRHGITVIEP